MKKPQNINQFVTGIMDPFKDREYTNKNSKNNKKNKKGVFNDMLSIFKTESTVTFDDDNLSEYSVNFGVSPHEIV